MLHWIKQLFHNIIGIGPLRAKPRTIQVELPKGAISRAAELVVLRLQDAGYEAYLVGGCVRDLLLGRHPKDFDVVTNARPEQTKPLFRGARTIGKRFRLVHVPFGNQLIEVATFRKKPKRVSYAGTAVSENEFGTLQDDVLRRDFSINALYLNPKTKTVLDYVGGLDALAARRLELIGAYSERFQEDPVRILRALRFAAALHLKLNAKMIQTLQANFMQLGTVAPARLFEELQKLFLKGSGVLVWDLCLQLGLFSQLPADIPLPMPMIRDALSWLDTEIALDTPSRITFIMAVLFWAFFQERKKQQGVQEAIQAFQKIAQLLGVPKRFYPGIINLWALQKHLERPQIKRIPQLLEQSNFEAAHRLMRLRAQSDMRLKASVQWWTHYPSLSVAEQEKSLEFWRTSAQRHKDKKNA